jgi:acetyl-CoA decarbonylase/synthase complex subunit delta
MEYKAPVETFTGKVREVVIGRGEKAIKIGGGSVLPFHFFEGKIDDQPKIALELYDSKPDNWAAAVMEPYADVIADPVAWAKKCLDYGADMVCLRLMSTDPAGENKSAEEAAKMVKKVVDSINAPVIVYGCGDEAKDVEVLIRVAEVCTGDKLLLGPVVKENYEPISKAALEHGHSIIAQSPLDINLEKELNVKLLKNFPPDRIVIDTLSSALGYGMEYSFTIMERTKHIGVMFGDSTMQMPIIADLGGECWKTKQARENATQGLRWEAVTATSLVLAGANILVLRHPANCKLMKEVIQGKF